VYMSSLERLCRLRYASRVPCSLFVDGGKVRQLCDVSYLAMVPEKQSLVEVNVEGRVKTWSALGGFLCASFATSP
jgi:hypothetical protein